MYKNRLLIITQKVDKNDSVLGFFHGWILEFAKHYKQLTVICLEKGEYDLPDNVNVLSLGKEENVFKFVYLVRFYKYIWQYRKKYNNVFVHMNPEYVILGGLFWKLLGKKVGLWYMHKSVTWKLKLAEKLATVIFTGSKESFRLNSKKLKVLHHGIDSNLFYPDIVNKQTNEKIILNVGRICNVKRQKDLVYIFLELRKLYNNAKLYLVGEPIYKEDLLYFNEIKKIVQDNNLQDYVIFKGSIPNILMPKIYNQASVLVNLSQTGSLDKDVLEAMSCNVPVVTMNSAFVYLLDDKYLAKTVNVLKTKIIDLLENDATMTNFRDIIIKNHNLNALINKISNII